MDQRTADPEPFGEVVILQPGDQLVIRINPDRRLSVQEFDRYRAEVDAAFRDRWPGARMPVIVVADQIAIQKPEGS
jgi:hypothetical protein